jgi:hypothetical protein
VGCPSRSAGNTGELFVIYSIQWCVCQSSKSHGSVSVCSARYSCWLGHVVALVVSSIECRGAFSSATALATHFLGSVEGRRVLHSNNGYARVLVVEEWKGKVLHGVQNLDDLFVCVIGSSEGTHSTCLIVL